MTTNDATTRDELRERVKTYLADFQDTTGYDNHDMNRLGDTYAQSIIALVTAARDAEIRSALLSDGAVGLLLTAVEDDSVLAMALSARKQRGDSVVCAATLNMGRDWLTAALDHIGLHGDGTGGQG